MDGAGVILAADFRKALVSGEDSSEKEHWNQEAVHRLPCRIDYDGPGRIEEYFHPQYINSDDETGIEEEQEGVTREHPRMEHASPNSTSTTFGLRLCVSFCGDMVPGIYMEIPYTYWYSEVNRERMSALPSTPE